MAEKYNMWQGLPQIKIQFIDYSMSTSKNEVEK